MIRKPVQYFLWFVVGMLCLLVLFALFLTLPPGESFCAAILSRYLSDLSSLNVTIDNLKTNLLFHTSVSTISVEDGTGKDGRRILSAGGLDVTYSIRHILRGRPDLNLKIDSLYVTITGPQKTGTPVKWHFPAAFLDSLMQARFQLPVKSVYIRDTQIALHDSNQTPSWQLRWHHIRFSTDPQRQDSVVYRLWAEKIKIRHQSRICESDSFLIHLVRRPDQILLAPFLLKGEAAEMNSRLFLEKLTPGTRLNGSVHIAGDVHALQSFFSPWLPQWTDTLTGGIICDFNLNGNTRQQHYAVNLDIRQIAFTHERNEKFIVRGTYTPSLLSLDTLIWNGWDGYLAAEFHYNPGEHSVLHADIAGKRIDIHRMALYAGHSIPVHSGLLDIRISGKGRWNNPETISCRGNLNISRMAWRGTSLPALACRFNIARGEGNLSLNGGPLNIQAKIRRDESRYETSLTAVMENMHLVKSIIRIPDLEGSWRLGGRISDLKWGAPINLDIHGRYIRTPWFNADSMDAGLHYDNEKTFTDIRVYAANYRDFEFKRAAIMSHFDGILSPPRSGYCDFLFQDGMLQQVPADSIRGRLRFSKTTLYLDTLILYEGLHRTGIRCELDTQPGGRSLFQSANTWKGAASGTRFNIRILNPLLPEGWQMGGRIDYGLSWHGTAANPELNGFIRLNEGSLMLPRGKKLTALQCELGFRDSLIALHSLQGMLDTTSFSMTGQMHMDRWQADAFAIRTDIDSGFFKAAGYRNDSLQPVLHMTFHDWGIHTPAGFLLPENFSLNGRLNGEIRVHDPADVHHRQFWGELTLSGLASPQNPLHINVQNGHTRLSLMGDSAVCDTFWIKTREGYMSSRGRFLLLRGGIHAVYAQTHIENLGYIQPDQYQIKIRQAGLETILRDNTFQITGSLELADSRYIRDFSSGDILSMMKQTGAPSTQMPGIFKSTSLALEIKNSRQVWIDNNLAHVRMQPKLHITGTPAKPHLTGHIDLEEGYILYLDRRFQIQNGTIDFIHPTQLKPVIHVDSRTELKKHQTFSDTSYVITMKITNETDELRIVLQSSPPLSEPEILSLLTLGVTQKDFKAAPDNGSKSGTVKNMIISRAGVLSARTLSSVAEKTIGRLFELDTLSIEGNLFQFDESWGPQLLASKTLAKNVKITYTTTVGHLNEQLIRLGYQLLPGISLEGMANQEGNAWLDLKYRIKF